MIEAGHISQLRLQAVARTIAEVCPERGVACRLSGDEFAALVPQIAADEAVWLRQGSRAEIGQRDIGIEGQMPVRITASDGLAMASAARRRLARRYWAVRQTGASHSRPATRGDQPLLPGGQHPA